MNVEIFQITSNAFVICIGLLLVGIKIAKIKQSKENKKQ